MLDDLRSVGLNDAARKLGCEPFDVVRLLVASGKTNFTLRFDAATIDALRTLARIDPQWWDGVPLPADPSPGRARVRAAVSLLQTRGHLGENRTRMDNVWRGLGSDEQDLLRIGLQALGEDGLLDVVPSPIGMMVSIQPKALDQVQQFVSGRTTPAALKVVLEG
jgi:hypothetical protein